MRKAGIASALAMVVIAVAAIPAIASAHEFYVSESGSLEGKAFESQVMKNPTLDLECVSWEPAGGYVFEGSSSVIELTARYENCTMSGEVVEPFEISYELDAEGLASITSAVTIKAFLGYCEVTIPAQSLMSWMSYADMSSGAIEVNFDLVSMISYGKGLLCEYPEESTTTLQGADELAVIGGELIWI